MFFQPFFGLAWEKQRKAGIKTSLLPKPLNQPLACVKVYPIFSNHDSIKNFS